jgi:hypothetical protein
MGKLKFQISMSLDGFVAGPNPSEENPLGEGGEQLHEWVLKLAAWPCRWAVAPTCSSSTWRLG